MLLPAIVQVFEVASIADETLMVMVWLAVTDFAVVPQEKARVVVSVALLRLTERVSVSPAGSPLESRPMRRVPPVI